MRISCQSFSLPKAGRSFVDCEDAYFPGESNSLQLYEVNHQQCDVFRASVTDGATDSIFSKLWAQLLAFGYGAGKWASDITQESIAEEQSAWLDFLAKQQLPWYAEEKAELGAFAAMVGLTLLNDAKTWTAMAVGDCCIFQIRNGECVKSFPITSSAAFSNFPLLLCSVAERNSKVFESKQVIVDGKWQSGDQFFLMSDTVACWFITQLENGNVAQTVAALESAQSLEQFVSIVNQARTTKGEDGNVLMKDDDVTFTIVRVADDADAPMPKKFSKNTAELPPIPAQRKTASADSANPTAPPSNSADPAISNLPPPSYSSSPYDTDATKGGGGLVNEASSPTRGYTNRSRTKSNQPGLAIFIAGAIAVAAAAIGAATLFSHSSDKHVKVEQQPGSETPQPTAKTGEASLKQSVNHRNAKHKLKKSKPVALAPDSSAHSSPQNPDAAQSKAPSASMPPNSTPPSQSDSSPVQSAPQQQSPQPAPDRHAAKPADRPITGTLDRMPPQAPDRNKMPLPAPDRTAATPVQLPEHVRQDHGSDRVHSSIGGHQHHRSNSPAKSAGQPDGAKPDRVGNDLPENLNFKN